jgi:hypothetical protein
MPDKTGAAQKDKKISNPAAIPTTGVLAETLAPWKLAFDNHQPGNIVELFSPEALFQGFTPTLLTGREEIFGYYDSLPPGITTSFQVVQTLELVNERSLVASAPEPSQTGHTKEGACRNGRRPRSIPKPKGGLVRPFCRAVPA